MIRDIIEVTKLIEQGKPLMLAGVRDTLKKLPRGNWIGGTIPFLNHPEQEDQLEITMLPSSISKVRLKLYSIDNIHYIRHDAYQNGFTFLILPAESRIHHSFAMNSRDYPSQDKGTVTGWVSGYSEHEKPEAYCIYGPTGSWYQDKAVTLHCQLKPGYRAELQTLNLFTPGDGPDLQFMESGFSCNRILVDGREQDLPGFLDNFPLSTEHPLISMEAHEGCNVSIQQISGEELKFYAPVFRDQSYRIARPISRYHEKFQEQLKVLKQDKALTVFQCNCILNHEPGKEPDQEFHHGPVSFGEIAEHLLNQTALSLRILED